MLRNRMTRLRRLRIAAGCAVRHFMRVWCVTRSIHIAKGDKLTITHTTDFHF